MEIHKQKTHALTMSSNGSSNLAINGPPPLARHSCLQGTRNPCQDAPLDLTKPLDLSVKRPRSPSTERSHATKCYREINLKNMNNRKTISPVVVPPFNFKSSIEEDDFLVQEHSQNCSRRTGLIGSSPRNYNYKGRAVVAPRKDHTGSHDQHHVEHNDTSAAIKHRHHTQIPMQTSVPYLNHSNSPANAYSKSSSSSSSIDSIGSSGHLSHPPPPYPTSGHGRLQQHDTLKRHIKPILPKSTLPIIVSTCSLADVADDHSELKKAPPALPPSRVAHVTAFTHDTTPFTQSICSSESRSLSHTSESHSDLANVYRNRQQDEFMSSHNRNSSPKPYQTGSITNGTPVASLQQAQKKLKRSHPVSPMRPSRNSYGKPNDRHSIPVLRMVEQSIAAAEKLNKLLKPIDGPESSRYQSRNPYHSREDIHYRNRLDNYNQPLRVDIPDRGSPSNVPPTLPHVLSNERLLQTSNDLERYTARMHQLSPPASACDRISPTMPVLVPHSIYSPVDLPGGSSDSLSDSNLPVLKNAKQDLMSATSTSIYNPLTLPFLSPVSDSRKVQSVPPIISESRHAHARHHMERQLSGNTSAMSAEWSRYIQQAQRASLLQHKEAASRETASGGTQYSRDYQSRLQPHLSDQSSSRVSSQRESGRSLREILGHFDSSVREASANTEGTLSGLLGHTESSSRASSSDSEKGSHCFHSENTMHKVPGYSSNSASHREISHPTSLSSSTSHRDIGHPTSSSNSASHRDVGHPTSSSNNASRRDIGHPTSPSTFSHEQKRILDQLARHGLDKLLRHFHREMSLRRSSHRNPHLSSTNMSNKTSMPTSNLPESKTTHQNSHVRNHADDEREIIRQLILQKRAHERRRVLERQRDLNPIKREPEVVDLTANSPEPAVQPKQEDYLHEISRERTERSPGNEQCTPKQSLKREQQKTSFRTPLMDVAGKTLTFKEAIETACRAASMNSKLERGNYDMKHMSSNNTDDARAISLVLNTKADDSVSQEQDSKPPNSFCHRHRRLLFPVDPKKEQHITSDCDIPRTEHNLPTYSQAITDQFKNYDPRKHDPRKKHLANLHTEIEQTTDNRVEHEKDVDDQSERLVESPIFTTSESEPSPPLPGSDNAEHRRRKRLNSEINRIANTSSYVGDLPKKPRSGDLLVDSSLLDREERALQNENDVYNPQEPQLDQPPDLAIKRAMLRFSEMEQRARFGTSADDIQSKASPKIIAKVSPKINQKIASKESPKNTSEEDQTVTSEVSQNVASPITQKNVSKESPKISQNIALKENLRDTPKTSQTITSKESQEDTENVTTKINPTDNVEPKKQRPLKPKGKPGRPPRGRGRGFKKTATQVKPGRRGRFPWKLRGKLGSKIVRRESPRINKYRISSCNVNSKGHHTFSNFKPEILQTRNRDGISDSLDNVDELNYITNDAPSSDFGDAAYNSRRNSVRKRTPYHKNARYELEIEKEEAKFLERKRKRTVSYGSNFDSGADIDTADDSSVGSLQPLSSPRPIGILQPPTIKRKRGRPKKTEEEKLLAAKSRKIRIKYQGVGRGKYPRLKKTLAKKAIALDLSIDVKPVEDNSSSDTNSLPSSGDIQPLQVLIDPDNHTKMKFVSIHSKPKKKKKGVITTQTTKKRGKYKRKTKHLGPASPTAIDMTSTKDVYDFDDSSETKMEMPNYRKNLNLLDIKQEPRDDDYETKPIVNEPPPVQVVRPEPPSDLKKLICNKKLGETVLHRACRMARDDVAIYCIDYQLCDINAKDNAGYTPLHECCVNGRHKVAEHLLRHGADVNASAADGTRPIHDATDNHRMDIVRLLLSFGADPLVATYSGRTALKLARNKVMREFIIGYIRDVNGEWGVSEDEIPDFADVAQETQWRFSSSLDAVESKSEHGTTIFGGIPEADHLDDVMFGDDVMFELSDTPHLPTYNLQLADDDGPKNWFLVSDVKRTLGVIYDDVMNTRDDIQPIRITRREFNFAYKEGLSSCVSGELPKEHGRVSDSETIALLEVNNIVRTALGIETEFIR